MHQRSSINFSTFKTSKYKNNISNNLHELKNVSSTSHPFNMFTKRWLTFKKVKIKEPVQGRGWTGWCSKQKLVCRARASRRRWWGRWTSGLSAKDRRMESSDSLESGERDRWNVTVTNEFISIANQGFNLKCVWGIIGLMWELAGRIRIFGSQRIAWIL